MYSGGGAIFKYTGIHNWVVKFTNHLCMEYTHYMHYISKRKKYYIAWYNVMTYECKSCLDTYNSFRNTSQQASIRIEE